ncbi:MAG: SRPBCC domain-containing protein [Myxococcota bacterium]
MGFEDAKIGRYELAVEIEKPVAQVWQALIHETNAWWLPDFHMVGLDSTVTLEAHAGGRLIEQTEAGASLLWATVAMVVPQERILFIGGHFPAWGGPATSMLEWRLESTDNGTRLLVSDCLIGHVAEETVGSLEHGWRELFTNGLGKHCLAK